jgi:glycosyltransferase involved in cell wall biosynthesis
VLYVGRIAAEKNLGLAVEAFLRLRAREPRARFVLVGDGPEREPLARAHPEFHYAGMLRGAELAAHYASGDMFLFASVTETFGNVTIEAMASGLPIVAFNHAAAGEIIESGVNGILASSNDEAGFMEASTKLGLDADMRSVCAQGAREKALQYSWESIVKKTEDVLYGVCAKEQLIILSKR